MEFVISVIQKFLAELVFSKFSIVSCGRKSFFWFNRMLRVRCQSSYYQLLPPAWKKSRPESCLGATLPLQSHTHFQTHQP